MKPEPSLWIGWNCGDSAAGAAGYPGPARRPREKEIIERGNLAAVVLFGDLNNHDAGRDDLENLGESVVELMDDVLARLGGRGRDGRRGCGFGCRGEDREDSRRDK